MKSCYVFTNNMNICRPKFSKWIRVCNLEKKKKKRKKKKNVRSKKNNKQQTTTNKQQNNNKCLPGF